MGNSNSAHNHEPLDRNGAFQRGTYGDAINTVRTRDMLQNDPETELNYGNAPKLFYYHLIKIMNLLIKWNKKSNIAPFTPPHRNPPHSVRVRSRRVKWIAFVAHSVTPSGGERTACPSPPNLTSGNPTSKQFARPPVPSPSSTWAVSRCTSPGACRSARRPWKYWEWVPRSSSILYFNYHMFHLITCSKFSSVPL